MARQIRYVGMIAAGLIGLVLVSCGSDSNPTTPTAPGGTPAAVTLVRVDVGAPESIPPGESAQLTATAVKSDGSTENVTSSTSWFSSNSRVIQVGSDGRARALIAGEASIQARYQGRTGSRVVMALPAGTYKVSGQITEATLPLQGVSLQVTRGTGEGLTTLSDSNGRFSFYGLAGDVRIQARKAGYIDAFRDLRVGSTVTDDFELAPVRQRKDLTGTYTMTVSAPTCVGSTAFPDELRSHTYTATVTQDGRAVNVVLSGAEFIVASGRGDRFSGTIDPLDNVTFTIGSSYYYYFYFYSSTPFDVVERIDDTRSFSIAGVVNASVRGSSEVAGVFSGSFMVLRGNRPPFTQLLTSCFSQIHPFVMRRR